MTLTMIVPSPTIEQSISISRDGEYLRAFGNAAGQAMKKNIFNEYRDRRKASTLRAHRNDLRLLAIYIEIPRLEKIHGVTITPALTGLEKTVFEQVEAQVSKWVEKFMSGHRDCAELTGATVSGFVEWMKNNGYATATINRYLSSVKIYAKLAHKAGLIPEIEYRRITDVNGLTLSDRIAIDETRKTEGIQTRKSRKKAAPTELSNRQIQRLLAYGDNSAQGLRDRLLIAMLLTTGVRASDAARFCGAWIKKYPSDPDNTLEDSLMEFIPKKTEGHGTTVIQVMFRAFYDALTVYKEAGLMPRSAKKPILQAFRTNKNNQRRDGGMSTQAIGNRVRAIGDACGIANLSPHDLRHKCTQMLVDAGMDAFQLTRHMGWTNPDMAMRYINKTKPTGVGYDFTAGRL